MKTKNNKFYIKVLANFTVAKLISALITIPILASFKYAITGNIYIDPSYLFTNIGVGLLGFTINTGFIGLLSEYLGIKGLNFSLKEFAFGLEKIQLAGTTPPKVSDKLKVKLYMPMDSGEQSNSRPLDQGKGVESTVPSPAGGRGFSGLDSSSLFRPRTNPGPGFNVPGGEVSLRDEICKYINYNPYFLKQFKTMDLETAVVQRDNYYLLIRNMNDRLAYAQNALNGEPFIPTTAQQLHVRNMITKDLGELNVIKSNAEGRVALINSRIEFIENNTR